MRGANSSKVPPLSLAPRRDVNMSAREQPAIKLTGRCRAPARTRRRAGWVTEGFRAITRMADAEVTDVTGENKPRARCGGQAAGYPSYGTRLG